MDPTLSCLIEEIRCSFLYMTTEVLGLTNRYLNKQVIDCIMNYFFENQVGQLLKPKMQLDSLKKVKRVVEDAIACDSEQKYRKSGLPKYMIFVNAYIDEIERYQIQNEYISLLYDIILSDCNEPAYSQEWMTTIRKKITAVLLLGNFNDRKNKTKKYTEDIFAMWKNVFPLNPLRKVKQNFKNKIQIPTESAEKFMKNVDINCNQNTDEIGLKQGETSEIQINLGQDNKKPKKIAQMSQQLQSLATQKPAKKRKTTTSSNSTKSQLQFPNCNPLTPNNEDTINNNTNNNGDEEETRFPQGETVRFNEEEEFQERYEWDTPEEETNPQNYCTFKNMTVNSRINEEIKSIKKKKKPSQNYLKSRELLKEVNTKIFSQNNNSENVNESQSKDISSSSKITQNNSSNLESHSNPSSNDQIEQQPQQQATNSSNETEDCMSQVPSPAQYLNFDMNSLHFDSDHQQNYFYEHSGHSHQLSNSLNISNSSNNNNNNFNLLNNIPNNHTNYYPTHLNQNTNNNTSNSATSGSKGVDRSNIVFHRTKMTNISNLQLRLPINNKDNQEEEANNIQQEYYKNNQNHNTHLTGIQQSNTTGLSEIEAEKISNSRELFNTYIPYAQEQFIIQDTSQPLSPYQQHSSDQQQLNFPLICSLQFQTNDHLEFINQDSPTRQLF